MIKTITILFLLLAGVLSGPGRAAETPAVNASPAGADASPVTRIAVLAYRPKPDTLQRWQPLIDDLNRSIPDAHFVLEALHYDELEAAAAARRVDFILTQPSHYVLLTYRNGLSSPLATLVSREGAAHASQFGGVIFTRADRTDITRLTDLRNKTLATTGRNSLGSFQMQAFELLQVGIRVPPDARLLETDQPQDRVIQAVLDGRADAGLVRTGVLESLSAEGKLDARQIKVIGAQSPPNFPFQVSTRLYPEWPFAAMPQVDPDRVRQVTGALLSLPHGGELAQALHIAGFTIPGDYRGIDELLRQLRLPPFDATPEFTFAEAWRRWQFYGVAVLLGSGILLLLAVIRMAVSNRRLRRAQDAIRDYAERLDHEHRHLQTLIHALPDLIWLKNPDGDYLACNPRVEQFFAAKEADIVGKTDYDFIDSAQAEAFRQHDRIAMARGGPSSHEAWVTFAADGHRELLEVIQTPVFDAQGQLIGVLGIGHDITERQRASAQIRKLSLAVEQSPESIVITDLAARIEYVNQAFVTSTGYSREEAFGNNPRMLQSGKTPAATYQNLWATLRRGEVWRGELINRRKDGSEYIEFAIISPVREQDRHISHYLAIEQDITERRQAEARLHHLAFFDALTGLPNRSLLLDRLAQRLAAALRQPQDMGALLLLNIDRFKLVNNARGNLLGDALLRAVGHRLRGLTRASDTVARMAADEFAVLLPKIGHGDELVGLHALLVAEKLHAALLMPFECEGETFTVSVSIGITLLPASANDTPGNVLRRADTALHRARAAGGNQNAFFEAGMDESTTRSFQIESGLREAIFSQELRLYLQPQVSAQGAVVGAEALLRWQHPRLGLVSPGVFIPVAEESNLIVDLGVWVMIEACRILARTRVARSSLRLSVNVSPRHFRQNHFVHWLKELLISTGADPAHLTLEITEGLFIDNLDEVVAKMSELTALGIHFSIDDFGTGYSSLAYLKRLPIQELKIDKAFVRDAPTDPDDAALVEIILAVATHLRLRVVAEGVETEAQAAFLNARAEVIHQGYLYGKPEPAEIWLARWQVAPAGFQVANRSANRPAGD